MIRNQSLQKSVSIPSFSSSDSVCGAQGSPAVSWLWREPALQSLSPLIVWPGPCPVPTQITVPQSALSRQRSTGSPLKTAWSIATSLLSASIPSHLLFFLGPFPFGFLNKTFTNQQSALQWTSQVPWDLITQFPSPNPALQISISSVPSGEGVFLLSGENPGKTREREWLSFLRKVLDT